MERVGSFNAYTQLVQYGVELQASTFKHQQKLATALKGQHYDDIASENLLVQGAQNILIKMEGYSKSAKVKLGEIEMKHATLQKVSDLLTRAKTLAASAMGASIDKQKFDSVNHTAKLLMRDLQSLLNKKHDTGYLFGGTNTDSAPVKIQHSTFSPQKSPSSADTKYFLGTDKATYISINEEHTIEDPVNANDPAIEKAIRSVAMLSGVRPGEQSTLKEAFSLLGDAVTGTARMLTTTGDLAKSLKDGISANTSVQLQTDATLKKLTGADTAQVMSDLANLQVVLQASYTSVAKHSQMSLLNFLR